MQAWAVGILATPVVATTVSGAALATSLRLKFGLNIGAAAIDATLQLALKDRRDFNFVSPIVSGLIGPESNIFISAFVTSFFGTFMNLSPNTLSGNGAFFNDPLTPASGQTIIIGTLFGAAGGYLGGAFKSDLPWGRYYGENLGNTFGGLGGVATDESLKRK